MKPSPESPAPNEKQGEFVVFTLCEPRYAVGAAALFNSLVASGFRGMFIVGLKGTPCGWLRQPPAAVGGARIRVVEIKTDRHLAHMKARFASQILDELEPACGGVIYFDPDIVTKAPWTDFTAQAGKACSVCADENPPLWTTDLPPWLEFSRAATGQEIQLDGPCINSGFIGVSRAHRRILEVWENLIVACTERGFDTRSFTWNGPRTLPFFFVDQDMLNLAIRLAGVPVWIGGPETMDFTPGGNWVSHAISTPKPWQRWYLPRALAGRAIRRCDIAFWQHAAAPITAVAAPARWLHQADLALARLLSRKSRA